MGPPKQTEESRETNAQCKAEPKATLLKAKISIDGFGNSSNKILT